MFSLCIKIMHYKPNSLKREMGSLSSLFKLPQTIQCQIRPDLQVSGRPVLECLTCLYMKLDILVPQPSMGLDFGLTRKGALGTSPRCTTSLYVYIINKLKLLCCFMGTPVIKIINILIVSVHDLQGNRISFFLFSCCTVNNNILQFADLIIIIQFPVLFKIHCHTKLAL